MVRQHVATTPKGLMLAISAFFMWGLFPLYFRLLELYHPAEIIGHRILWSCALGFLWLLMQKQWGWLSLIKQNPKWLLFTFLSGCIITINWLSYVWAVNNEQVLAASLGYFINPIIGILLSLIVLKERLRRLQKFALLLAAIGVGLQIVLAGRLPIISLLLGFSFAIYGLMHRHTPLNALAAMFLETLLLSPFVIIGFMLSDVSSSRLDFWLQSPMLLLILSGPITLIPLLLFNKSTKLVTYSLISFISYLSPTMAFFLAIVLFGEPFSASKLITFAFIWAGLICFSYDLLKQRRMA